MQNIKTNGRELIEAVHKNDLKRVKELLDSGVRVDARRDHSQNALMQAAADGNSAMVDFLISKNAPVNTFDFWSGTPLLLRHSAPDTWSRRVALGNRRVWRVSRDHIDFSTTRWRYG